jgi:cytochrome c peroxidase
MSERRWLVAIFFTFLTGSSLYAEEEKKGDGYQTFVRVGCIECHDGATYGGLKYRKLGRNLPWANQDNLGKYNLTLKPEDKMVFKVPSLIGVGSKKTFFHDKSASTLEEAVKMMANHQLGVLLKEDEVKEIAQFLRGLK